MLFANLNEDKHVQDDSLKLSFVVKCLEMHKGVGLQTIGPPQMALNTP